MIYGKDFVYTFKILILQQGHTVFLGCEVVISYNVLKALSMTIIILLSSSIFICG